MNSKQRLLLCSLTMLVLAASAGIRPERLTCEYMSDPMAVDAPQPRLSWVNVAGKNEKGLRQTAWQIQVASSPELLAKGEADLWDSGRQPGEASVAILYGGNKLVSGQDCYWRVRVWTDGESKPSTWSKLAVWHMGLLEASEWKAQWIGAPWESDEATARSADKSLKPAPLLRKRFMLKKEVRKAYLYICGLGYFEFFANGRKVGNDVLVPNQTDYSHRPDIDTKRVRIDNSFTGYRTLYMCYDLRPYLRRGENAVGCLLGCGFFNSFQDNYVVIPYGSPRMIAQIEIEYADGSHETVCSDTSWEVKESYIVEDDVYLGEHADGRLRDHNWCTSAEGWQKAVERKAPEGRLEAQTAYPDRVCGELQPVSIEKKADGKWGVNFGAEISGWVHLKNINGSRGRKISIRYICDNPSGGNSYICAGDKNEDYHARFTWFVFSKAEISGWEGELHRQDITAEYVHTVLPQVGHFACSDTLVNKIQEIWQRSLLDNAHGGIFSDCPHRERIGYTGDGQAACEAVMHIYDGRPVYSKWMRDILLSQNPESGYVPNAAPWESYASGGAAWGAAMIIIPHTYYKLYRDTTILAQNYQGMINLMRYFANWVDEDGIMFTRHWVGGQVSAWHNLGEWVTPSGVKPKQSLMNTYFYWLCAKDLSQIAAALGKSADEKKFAELAEQTRRAFHKRFYDPELHSYGSDGSNIFALDMGIPTDPTQLSNVVATVRTTLRRNGGHIDTGIFGTKLFFEVLTRYGLSEEAYEAFTKTDCPSYGWMIKNGATTTWEYWNGHGSHNHPMLGGGLTWLYRRVAGLDINFIENGNRRFVVHPYPPQRMDWAEYSCETIYGKAAAGWKRVPGGYIVEATVPVGCTATVVPPEGCGRECIELKSGIHRMKFTNQEITPTK